MAKARVTGIRLNTKRMRDEVLRAPSTREDMLRRAEAVAARAGEGYEASVRTGANRVRASVITATAEARIDNGKNHTLLRALDAARG